MALDPHTPLPDLGVALAGSRFEEATSCIQETLATSGITTIGALENATKGLTCSFCGVPTNKFITYVYRYLESPPEPEPEPEPEAAPMEEEQPEEVVEVAEVELTEEEPTSKGRSKKTNRKG